MPALPMLAAGVVTFCSIAVAAQQLTPQTWGERFASPGASLALVEVDRTAGDQGTTVAYNLRASGLSQKLKYTLWVWPLGEEPEPMPGSVRLRSDGTAICTGNPGECAGQGVNAPIVLDGLMAKGEPLRAALVSGDGKLRAFATVAAFPILVRDGRCTVELQRRTKDASQIAVLGSGFEPGERVTMQITTETEGTTLRSTADAHGAWSTAVAHTPDPARPNGETQILAHGKSCEVTLPWQWGVETQKKQ